MKAYLDLMFILNLVINLGAFHMIDKVIGKKQSKGLRISMSFLLAFKILLIYFKNYIAIPLDIIISCAVFIGLYKRRFITKLILYYLYQAIVVFLLVVLLKPHLAMRNLIVVVTSYTGAFAILLAVIFYFLVDLSVYITDHLYHLLTYKTEVMLTSSKSKKILSAYYDSGNTLSYKRSPVIFIKQGSFEFEKEEEVPIEDIDNTVFPYPVLKIYRVLLTSQKAKESYFVYAAEVDKNADFYGCDLLLNVYLRR